MTGQARRRPAARGPWGNRPRRPISQQTRRPQVWQAAPVRGSARPAIAVLSLIVCAGLFVLGVWAHKAGLCGTSLLGIGGAVLYLRGRSSGRGIRRDGRW